LRKNRLTVEENSIRYEYNEQIINAIPNLHHANKALTEGPEIIVCGPYLKLHITRSI